MSAIRLNGTSSGYTELAPPATAGSNTITLPSSNGSANQFLKNGSTAGTLGWSSMVEDSSGNVNIDSGTFYVDATNNRVGVLTSSPTTSLDVNGTIRSNNAVALQVGPNSSLRDTTSGASSIFFDVSTGSATHGAFEFRSSSAFTTRLYISATGEILIAGTADQGAYNLQCNGTGVWGAGAYVNGSDERLKEDIQPLADASEVLQKLRPVSFKYKADYSRDQSIQPGFIAQELQEAMAGQVYLDGVVQQGPEYLNVAYQGLIPVLTKALQEALDKIASLEARITALEAA